MLTKKLYAIGVSCVNTCASKTDVRPQKTDNAPALPTPHGIVEVALAHYAVHVAQTAAEIAQACEALRLLHERPEAAMALFDPETTTAAPPATDKQHDLLAKLGYTGAVHNRGHASTLISNLLDKRRLAQRGDKSVQGNRSRDTRRSLGARSAQ